MSHTRCKYITKDILYSKSVCVRDERDRDRYKALNASAVVNDHPHLKLHIYDMCLLYINEYAQCDIYLYVVDFALAI